MPLYYDPVIMDALRAFRDAHGPNWRGALNVAWLEDAPITGVSRDHAIILARLRTFRRKKWWEKLDLDKPTEYPFKIISE
jgi:hypothetical protein